jgi:hypothetical protein
MANGLFDLYESGFARADLERGLVLVDRILEDFWDDGLYFTPSTAALPLIHRPLAPFDGACASGLSASVMALLRAHALSGRVHYGERARAVLARFEAASARNFFGFAHLLAAREFEMQGPTTIAFGGEAALPELLLTAHRSYLPGRVLALVRDVPAWPGIGSLPPGAVLGQADEAGLAHVCRAGTCLPAVRSVGGLRKALGLAEAAA